MRLRYPETYFILENFFCCCFFVSTFEKKNTDTDTAFNTCAGGDAMCSTCWRAECPPCASEFGCGGAADSETQGLGVC